MQVYLLGTIVHIVSGGGGGGGGGKGKKRDGKKIIKEDRAFCCRDIFSLLPQPHLTLRPIHQSAYALELLQGRCTNTTPYWLSHLSWIGHYYVFVVALPIWANRELGVLPFLEMCLRVLKGIQSPLKRIDQWKSLYPSVHDNKKMNLVHHCWAMLLFWQNSTKGKIFLLHGTYENN